MHVSWFWIKQRPQFIAEELSKHFEVTVACMEDYNNQALLDKESSEHIKLVGFSIFNNKNNNNWISKINGWRKKKSLEKLIADNEVIWFNAPTQFTHARKLLQEKHFIVYDCMDDACAFLSDDASRVPVKELESALCKNANQIFTSATQLKKVLQERYAPEAPIAVVNNALVYKEQIGTAIEKNIEELLNDNTYKHIVYTGTIASWFDFEAVIYFLEKNQSADCIVIGPTDTSLPKHGRLHFPGAVPHTQIAAILDRADALIMPFVVTILIESVNPVKAYEYIASGKPVILTRYAETICFESYAYLYKGAEELSNLVSSLCDDTLVSKKNREECVAFAKANTWTSRAEQMVGCIKPLLEKG